MYPEPRARRSRRQDRRSRHLPAALTAEEAIEEILHVTLLRAVIVALLAVAPPFLGVALCFGSDSVLMFTTAGPTCFTICEKPFESVTGEGITSARASDESTFCSLPLTFRVRTEPARIPTESVASSVKLVVRG